MSTRSRPTCYQKAIELLAPRAHFRRELQLKLERRGYAAAEVEAVLARLAQEGLLDDVAAARAFVARKLRGSPLGRRRLAAELARRGVAEEVIDEALASLDDDDRPLARQVAERWLARDRRPPSERRDAALARFLARRGFSERAIVHVLRQLPGGEAAADPNP
ncbi:MAG: regulatory protein RecX [Acidobacteria bacterium]|nr:MAG: regulatory protein RecX [Acidobacteriota bacterium]